MFTRFSPPPRSRLQAFFKAAALLLCLNLLLPLAWEKPCQGAAQAAFTVFPAARETPVITRKLLSRPLPATLTEAPSIMPRTGLGRSGQRASSSPDPSKAFWAALSEAPRLPVLRIIPFVRDAETPSFMLPSEHGLISFALPPPLAA